MLGTANIGNISIFGLESSKCQRTPSSDNYMKCQQTHTDIKMKQIPTKEFDMAEIVVVVENYHIFYHSFTSLISIRH